MNIRFLTLILLISLLNNAFGGSSVPPPTSRIISVPATVKKDPVQKVRLGNFFADFEKTTLSEIRSAIHAGSIDHSGEAGGSQYWLCYSLPGQRIWFISNGEMGGREHALTQIHAVSGTGFQGNDSCPSLPKSFQPVSFDFGWIGTDQDHLLKILGQPSGKQGANHIYYYEGKKPAKDDGKTVEWDVVGYMEAKIVNGKIASLYVSHVTSY
jgi:hypothetical protein